jgi:hypothetical protein
MLYFSYIQHNGDDSVENHMYTSVYMWGVIFMFCYVRYKTTELQYTAKHHSLQTVPTVL